MNVTERADAAVQAAISVAARLGMVGVSPAILKDSNHTSILLSPSPIVARVVVASDSAVEKLARELAVSSFMADDGAPVIGPSIDPAPGPHETDGMAMTFWRFVPHRPADDEAVGSAARALRICHDSLAKFPGELPPFTQAMQGALDLLKSNSELGPLADNDRAFLMSEYERLNDIVDQTPSDSIALHGDPHLGNVFVTSSGARWGDWESACRGPLEWDLSCVPRAGHDAWIDVNVELLQVLDDLRGLCVSVWCWEAFDRSAEKREAAQYHLDRLRRRSEVGR